MKLKTKHLILSSVLTLVMIAGVLSGGISTVLAETTIPTNKTLKVQMNTGAKEYYDKLSEEDGKLVIDLYKVADIQVRGKTDNIELLYPSDSVISQTEFDELKKLTVKEKNAQEYNDIASNTLNKLFSDGKVSAKNPAYSGIELSEVKTIDNPGMYLLVVRGAADDSTFVNQITQKQIEKANGSDENAKEMVKVNYVTTTELGNYTFTCAPQLITLPYRDNLNSDAEWSDLDLTLKMIADPLTTSIKIRKSLKSYNDNQQNATCVFRVDVYDPDDDSKLLRSEYYSLTFTKAGDDELTVDGLPIGSKIEVVEEYSGFGYKLTNSSNTTFTLTDETIQTVFFENENEGSDGGGGLVNHFSADEELRWSYDKGVDENGEYVEFDNGFTNNGRQYLKK